MSKISAKKQQLLDEFEARTDSWSYTNFERALKGLTGGSYQAAKMLIVEADDDGRWPKTVKRYILTNYASFNSSPMELKKISNRLLSSMTEQERREFGIDIEK